MSRYRTPLVNPSLPERFCEYIIELHYELIRYATISDVVEDITKTYNQGSPGVGRQD